MSACAEVLCLATSVMPSRTVLCEDALPWLRAQPSQAGWSFFTSLPDVSELPRAGLSAWKDWFIRAAETVLAACPNQGAVIFYQTDIKKDGVWIDKGFLCQKAAENEGSRLLWHKVVCRTAPGNVTHGRPAYAHLLCFSRGLRVDLGRGLPDVLPDGGTSLWTRGLGLEACALGCRFLQTQTNTTTVVDPFCGIGTVLAVANAMGLDAVGVELHRKRAKKARALKVVRVGTTYEAQRPQS